MKTLRWSKTHLRIFGFAAMCVWLCACGTSGGKNTLGGLKYKPEKEEKIEFKKMTHQEVRKEYKELLDLFEDKQLKQQIERRIADVYMMEGEHKQNKNVAPRKKSYYVEAIKSYRKILEKYPNSPDNADVFYQLAKAYDMEGNQKEAMKMLTELTRRHPTYVNIAEAHFRKGDIHFNNQQYKAAEQSYGIVTRQSNAKLALNAHYMLGWSYYKQFKFNASLDSFSYVLAQLMAEKTQLSQLDKAGRNLAKDTIHSMSLGLHKTGGADSIKLLPRIANKPYIWLIYDELGDYYLDKELYEESANTFRLFVNTYPQNQRSPGLHEKLIKTYIKGGFPKQALKEKESFVVAYGVRSNYAGNKGGIRKDILPSLKKYIEELAKHYHSQGQEFQKEIAKEKSPKNKKKPDGKKIANYDARAVASYIKAADFYNQFIETFPNDPTIDNVVFLKAEALFSARQYAQAIGAYETVAYKPKGTSARKHAADSGYAAIISYQKHIDKLGPKNKGAKEWQKKAVDSMLRFSGKFHADKRAPSVLTNAAEYLFSLNQYQRAVEIASGLIKGNVALDPQLKKTAYGIMAHSYFKLNDFKNAEIAYFNQRKLVNPKSKEYADISERLSTSIYKKAEEMMAGTEKKQAINQLLKIKRLTPKSDVRVTAQYDATTLMIEFKQWNRAIAELKELRALFPKHKLAPEFPRKLAFSYEQSGRWSLAAASYMELFKTDKNPTIRREALFIAANMYEKAKNYPEAIEQFKVYAYSYAQPFDTRMEARYHLATNYEKIGDIDKKLYWLRQVVKGDREAGKARTDRSKWLAAWANMEYGDYFAKEYRSRKLYLPLVKSLPAKNKLLKDASTRYQMSADYGILEFVTMSSYKIAGLYEDLALQLRKSRRPPGLSAEERKIYAEIIEEQAGPLEGIAMDLHQANIERAWDGSFNEWIERSYAKMQALNPARFAKTEVIVTYGDEIR